MTREQITAFINSLAVGDVIEVIWEKSGNRSIEEGKVWQPGDSQYLALGPDLLNPDDPELINVALFSKAPGAVVTQPAVGSVAVFVSQGVPNLPNGIYAYKRLKAGWYLAGGGGPFPWSLVTKGRTPTQVFSPGTPPAAPVINTLTPGDRTLLVAATLGAPGSTAISDLQYNLVFTLDEFGQDTTGWVSSGQTTGSFTIGNLTNDVPFSVRIRAVNSAGPGAASNLVTATPAAPSP